MSKRYSCTVCNQTFNKKNELANHIKNPCNIQEEYKELETTSSSDKQTLINIFKNCLNILRDNEGLTGDKALRTIAYLLILKLLEPRFGNEIDIDGYDYDFTHIEDCMVSEYKRKLLLYVHFSELSKRDEGDIPATMNCLWEEILSNHPSTSKIFLKGKSFDIQHESTYRKLIDKLKTIPETDYDVLGNAYEEVIQYIMTGKVLGQFFTQPLIKKMMVKLIDPQIYSDGKIDSCCDPTMGTGGFLITYMQYIFKKAKDNNITLDWNFIKNEGLYGKELDPDTYHLAVANMLISSGSMFDSLERGDSIREPITRKFDTILANPPFGIKGLRYDDFQSSLKFEYTPIKTDNAVSLFIQAIIYMLKINGKCAVVLPDGQDLFSKTNKTLIIVREYLLKTCDLKEIIYLPPGMFEYTSIKTCIFYFVKKMEGVDVMETKIKISKTQREMGRNYKFLDTHQTVSVKFYNYNSYEDVKNLLVEVSIERIASNVYSLNYAEYMKDETKEEHYEDSVIIKTLGEICSFLPKSKRQASYGNKKGLYPFFKSSNKINSYVDEPDYEEESLIIGTGGSANIKHGHKFSCSTDNLLLKTKNTVIAKYIYYYLSQNINILENGFIGSALKHISKKYISKIKIPIPSLEHQHRIVKYLDFIHEKTNKTSNEKISELKQLNEFCLNNQKIFGENEVKTIEEVCSIDYGTLIVKGRNTEGEYSVYGSGRAMFSTNTFNREGYNILIGRSALSLKCVRFVNEKIFLNASGLSVKPNTDILLHKYLGYYLLHNQSNIYNCARGVAQKNLEVDKFKLLKIHIPTVERQQEIVEYCENNDNIIKQIEKEIENNKKQALQFLTSVLKSVVRDEEDENSETIHEPKNSTTIELPEDENEDNDYEEAKE